ncbi:MAG: hypothetical protein GX167_04140 [Firmicutes bacterium]|jgi:vancomycin resistance protein YoaR|nr:hypothetical protein [Bacillota bacterium]
MRRKKQEQVRCLLAILVLLLAAGVLCDYFLTHNRIYAGVRLEHLDLGGKTAEEAKLLLHGALVAVNFPALAVTLTHGDAKFIATCRELGITADLEKIVSAAFAVGRNKPYLLRFLGRLRLAREGWKLSPAIRIDQKQFAATLEELCRSLEEEPVNAELELTADRKSVIIVPDSPGRKVDHAATARVLQQTLKSLFRPLAAGLILTPVQAEVTAAELEALAIKEPVATYSTLVSDGIPNRVHNIRLAAAALDKIIIYPGEEFSFNDAVGNTTAAKGYKTAPVIVDGELVDGLGGGVCQVSTTLYNAVLRANLQVLERRNHSLYVDYVPPGFDATVAYGSIDLRFANTNPYPLWLRTFLDGNRLTVTFYSTLLAGQKTEVYATDVVTIPAGEKILETHELPKGTRKLVKKGKNGYKATVWRVTTVNGEEKREKISEDSYKAVPAEYLVGTGEIPAADGPGDKEKAEAAGAE